jgi:cytochrome P450
MNLVEREGGARRLPTARTHPFDLPPELRRLREEHSLCRLLYPDGHTGWLVTSHTLARAVLADRRFSVRPPRRPVGDAVRTAELAGMSDDAVNSGILITLDPPQHKRLRRMQSGHFTAHGVNRYRGKIERIVADRLDAMERAGSPVDLVEMFALPVPSLALCEILGMPSRDRTQFERPTAIIEDPESTADEVRAAAREFTDYARSVIEQKRVQPGDDLLSDLVVRGELTDDELVGVALQLFTAGHDTTASQLAISTFALLCDRRLWEALGADPALVDRAVEELLRYLTIVQVGAFTRTAQEDVELGGVLIKAGEAVTVSLLAANRDPAKFAYPDLLDPSRGDRSHLAFGHGIHMCLGQHLARLELQAALRGLTQRFPTMQLAVAADEVPMRSGDEFLYGVRMLLVAW